MSEARWYEQGKWLIWFFMGVYRIGLEYGLVSESEEDPTENDEVLQLYGKFSEAVQPMSEYAEAAEAARDFKSWATTQIPRPAQGQHRTLSMKISKVYGGVVLELGISSQFTIDSPRALSAAFDTLAADLKSQFEAQERLLLPTIKQPTIPAPSGSHEGNAKGYSITFHGDTLNVEVKDGKHFFKIRGGQYSRHGVRVWPEVLKAAGINPETVPADGMPLDRECEVSIEDGKIRKVTNIQ